MQVLHGKPSKCLSTCLISRPAFLSVHLPDVSITFNKLSYSLLYGVPAWSESESESNPNFKISVRTYWIVTPSTLDLQVGALFPPFSSPHLPSAALRTVRCAAQGTRDDRQRFQAISKCRNSRSSPIRCVAFPWLHVLLGSVV